MASVTQTAAIGYYTVINGKQTFVQGQPPQGVQIVKLVTAPAAQAGDNFIKANPTATPANVTTPITQPVKPFGALTTSAKLTAQTTVAQPDAQKPAKKPTEDNNQPFKKTGESWEERMNRYHPTKGGYKSWSDAEKKHWRDMYFDDFLKDTSKKPVERRIRIESSDFAKLIHNTRDPEERRSLVNKISGLYKQNQIPGIISAAIDETDPALREIGQIGSAQQLPKLHPDNQLEAVKLIAGRFDSPDAVKIAAGLTSKLAPQHQVAAVKTFEEKIPQNTQLIQRDSQILKEVNLSFVNQYPAFAKNLSSADQLAIHKMVVGTGISEVITKATNSIQFLSSDIRSQAVQEVKNVYGTLSDTDKATVDASIKEMDEATEKGISETNSTEAAKKVEQALNGKDRDVMIEVASYLSQKNKLDADTKVKLFEKMKNSDYIYNLLVGELSTVDSRIQPLLLQEMANRGDLNKFQERFVNDKDLFNKLLQEQEAKKTGNKVAN